MTTVVTVQFALGSVHPTRREHSLGAGNLIIQVLHVNRWLSGFKDRDLQ